MWDICGLRFQAVGVLLDDWVDEDFAGDAVNLYGGLLLREVLQGEEEVLALANVLDALVFHATERVCDGLALGVEDGAFEGDEDVGFHVGSIIEGMRERDEEECPIDRRGG